MSGDDRPADRQPQAHALRLRGDERFECRNGIVETDPVVGDLDHGVVGLGTLRSDRQLLHAAADRFQCLERVEHEIQHQLLQLNPIGEDGRQIGVQHDIEGHVLARRVAVEQAKHLANDLAEIERHFLDGRPFEQGAHSPNDLAGVLAVLDDPFCCLHGLGNVRRRRGQPSQAGVSVGHDGGERLIDFVRDRSRHFPQACDPWHLGQLRLRPPQRLFCSFPLCDVFGERHQEPRHALGARNEGHVVADPDRAAVLASVLLLDLKLSFAFLRAAR